MKKYKGKPVIVTKENPNGRNIQFKNTRSGQEMSRPKFIKAIERGQYPDYHVRVVGKIKTPASNPDGKEGNNLG